MAMSTRIAAPGKSTRRWLAGTTAAALVLLGTPILTIAPASAAISSANFEIDGNTSLQGSAPLEDWNTVAPSLTTAPPNKVDLPDVGDKTARVLSYVVDNTNATGGDDSVFTQNNKESVNGPHVWPDWVYENNGNAAGKTDFGFVATYSWVNKVSDHVYLAIAFDRKSATGTDGYYFELNQEIQSDVSNANPTRNPGDLRFYVKEIGGSSLAIDATDRWDGSAWVPTTTGEYSFQSNFGANPATSPLPGWWQSYNTVGGALESDTFVEGVLDLTTFKSDVLDCPAEGFAALNARSLTGNSDKNLSDYIRAEALDIPSSCAFLKIKKFAMDGTTPLNGASFEVSPDPTPGSDSTDPITVTDGGAGDQDGVANGVVDFGAADPDTYTVTETGAPAGYIKVPQSQSVELVKFQTGTATFKDPLGLITWDKTYEGGLPEGTTGAQFKVVYGGSLSDSAFEGISGIASVTNGAFYVTDNEAPDADSTIGGFALADMPVGDYTITEETPPVGFSKDATVGSSTVPDAFATFAAYNTYIDNGGSSVSATVDNETVDPYTFVNPRLLGHLGVMKYAANGTTALGGATFELFKKGTPDVSMGTCTTRSTSDATLGAKGTCYISALDEAGSLAWGETYYWVEISPPAGYNISNTPTSADVELTAAEVEAQDVTDVSTIETVSFNNPQTLVVTKAQGDDGSVTEGFTTSLPAPARLFDEVTITGASDPDTTDEIDLGYVTFYLFKGTAPTCDVTGDVTSNGPLVFKSDPYAVTGSGTVTMPQADGYLPTSTGTYYWHAVFTSNYPDLVRGGSDECGDISERSVVNKAPTDISTLSTPASAELVPAGVKITDTIKITGLSANATGTVNIWFSGNDGICQPDGESTVPSWIKQIVPYGTVTPAANEAPVQKDLDGNYFAEIVVDSTVFEVGTYNWQVSYEGDANNDPTGHACGADNGENLQESTTITKAQPEISTVASVVGEDSTLPFVKVTDTAEVTGIVSSVGEENVGSVTFQLYGPFNGEVPSADVCETSTFDPITVDLTYSDGKWTASVPAPGVSVTDAGRYRWIATYSGDEDNAGIGDGNAAASGSCLDPNEDVTVNPAEPEIVTLASGDQTIGAGDTQVTVTDDATVSNLPLNAEGTVQFALFGPFEQGDPITCDVAGSTNLVGTDSVALDGTTPEGGSETVTGSVTFDLSTYPAGTYAWKATFVPAEGEYSAVGATHACGAVVTDGETVVMDELVVINPTEPAISTLADQSAVLQENGAPVLIKDTATVTGLSGNATGPVSFQLYGPGDATCATAIGTVTGYDVKDFLDAETGTAVVAMTAASALPVTQPGTYRWIARYAGDDNNKAVAGKCNDPGESTVVKRVGIPGLDKSSPNEAGTTFNPSGSVASGSTINYTITLKNTGDLPVTSDLVDTLPAGLSNPRDFTKDGVAAPPTTIAGQVLTWASVTVNGGQTVLVNFNVTVSATVDPGTFIEFPNTATWANLTDKTLHRLVGPGIEIKPTLSKTSDPVTGSEVKVGDVITYTVKVGNDGNVALTGDLVDTLPGGIEVVGNYTRDDGGKAEPDKATSQTLVWNAVTVQPGQTVTFTYDVKVLDAALDLDALVNTAEWLGLKAGTSHTVLVPELPQTGGSGADPMITIGWAGALLTLGLMFLLMGRRREIDES